MQKWHGMSEAEARGIFTLAGLDIERLMVLVDGYGYPPSDERFFETPPQQVWWFVKTALGWIEIGWRKRVIQIDWTDTALRGSVTPDDVTKSDSMVHAWSVEKAIEYLRALQMMAAPPSASGS